MANPSLAYAPRAYLELNVRLIKLDFNLTANFPVPSSNRGAAKTGRRPVRFSWRIIRDRSGLYSDRIRRVHGGDVNRSCNRLAT